MNAITRIDQEDVTIADWAREALEATGGSTAAAADYLASKVLSDQALLAAHLPQIVKSWAKTSVGNVLKNVRSNSRSQGPQASPAPVDGGVLRAAMDANLKRLMDTPLWGGQKIGDATADEIYASADNYDKSARTLTRQATWQAAVAAALEKNGTPGDRVRDCLTEATLSTLWEEAGGN